MMTRKLLAAAAIGTLALFSGACGDTESTAPVTTSPAPIDTSIPDDPESTMENPNGDGSVVPCEGTICTNPNHGAGPDPEGNGGAVMENPNGDGSVVPCEGTICTNPNHGAG